MEPKNLMIGQIQEVINIPIEELNNFGTYAVGSNNKDIVKKLEEEEEEEEHIDFVVIGAGLSEEIKYYPLSISIESNLTVKLIERIKKGVLIKKMDSLIRKQLRRKLDRY